MADKALSKRAEEELLDEMRERFQYATDEWRDIREEARKDMRFVAGDPWDEKDRKIREDAGRPCLAADELGQYVNQAINDVRANPRAVKFSPTGNGANDAAAEFYANKTREIEFRSKAQMVYTTAFENTIQRGHGYLRVKTKYKRKSFDQEIWLEPFVNPDLVTPDPDALMPDSSDMKYCFVHESRTVKEFRRAFPKAKIQSFDSDMARAYPQWIQGERIQLAEYWAVKVEPRVLVLYQLPDGSAVAEYAEDVDAGLVMLPEGAQPVDEREEDVPTVCQYLTNGVEILETNPWPGKYIPIISCYGKVLYVDAHGAGAKRKILSMVRLARDPYMLYCYIRTCEAEAIGGVPRNSWVGYKGQFSNPTSWQKANHEPVAYLEAEPTIEGLGQQVLPLPMRQPWDPPIQNLEIAAESARRAIQAAMGTSFLPTQAQKRNEKSGKALQKIDEQAQKGSFHFVDHYNDMIEHVGVILEDLMDKIYDTARQTGVRKQDESSEIVTINDPNDPQAVQTKGEFLVTIATGPSYDSQREEARDFVETLMSTPFAPMIADLAIKLRQLGPLGDEMAERLTPPEFRKPQNGQMDPAQLQQMLGMLKQENEQLKQVVQEALTELKTKRFEIEAKKEIELAKIRASQQEAGLAAKTDIVTTAEDNATKLRITEMEAELKLVLAKLEAREAEIERHHQQQMAREGHVQTMAAGKQQIAGKAAIESAKPRPAAKGEKK